MMKIEPMSRPLEKELTVLVKKWLTVSPERHRRDFREDVRAFARKAEKSGKCTYCGRSHDWEKYGG